MKLIIFSSLLLALTSDLRRARVVLPFHKGLIVQLQLCSAAHWVLIYLQLHTK